MIETLTFKRVELDTVLKPFDCACDDPNGFFAEDAIPHLRELLAVTFVFENTGETVAFFSVLNDRITKADSTTSIFRKISVRLPREKRYSSIPSVKIGRFGVHRDYQRHGIGTEIMDYIKALFTTANRTGCRCVTVDAYNNRDTLRFYGSNGFDFLTDRDAGENTRLMYFDLKRFVR